MPKSIFFVFFTFAISSPYFPINGQTNTSLGYYEDSPLNFTELTKKHGYISEVHKAITHDGYILTMFRIVKAKNCGKSTRSPPVLLMHGLFLSSNSWIDSGPESGLAYLIADACYDLWIGNVRGNYYSRHHVQLDPDEDKEFWDFDIDKIGAYDVPAMIDYVLHYTNKNKLSYIGFSQGGSSYFVMCSERPGYCDKAQVMVALASPTRLINTKSILFRGFLETVTKLEDFLFSNGFQELFPNSSVIQKFLVNFCQLSGRSSSLCEYLIKLIDHADSINLGSISEDTIKVLFKQFPIGSSLRNVARYGQSLQSSEFGKYDYGKRGNLEIYGNKYPPIYNLSAVTVPVVCFYGKNDGLVDSEDIKWLMSKLPNVIDLIEVMDPLWTHLDFTYSRNTREMVFNKLNKYLLKNSYA